MWGRPIDVGQAHRCGVGPIDVGQTHRCGVGPIDVGQSHHCGAEPWGRGLIYGAEPPSVGQRPHLWGRAMGQKPHLWDRGLIYGVQASSMGQRPHLWGTGLIYGAEAPSVGQRRDVWGSVVGGALLLSVGPTAKVTAVPLPVAILLICGAQEHLWGTAALMGQRGTYGAQKHRAEEYL